MYTGQQAGKLRSRFLKQLQIPLVLGAFALMLGSVQSLVAEQGVLVLYVTNTEGKPLSGVQLTVKGDGGTARSREGKARVVLAKQTAANAWVTLAVLSPNNLVFVSPWDERAQVPPFENESMNYVSVILAERGHRQLLENPAALRAMIQRATQAPNVAAEKPAEQHRREALSEVAGYFGLVPEEVDQAIRTWVKLAAERKDPYEKGLAELYDRNYSAASRDLAASANMRRERAQQSIRELVDADLSLAASLYNEGKYKSSAGVYEETNRYRAEDPLILNGWANSLLSAGDYAGAEPLYRRALAIDHKALDSDHVDISRDLNNLALLLKMKGDYAEAEPLYRRALAIAEKRLGPDHPDVGVLRNNLAELFRAKGEYAEAEPLYRRVLSVHEKALGPDDSGVARDLSNLAGLLQAKAEYAEAEPLYRRALAIDEKALGYDHPNVGKDLNNLATLLRVKGDYAGAESLYRRALAIDEKALGPVHADVGTDLNNLAELFGARGDYVSAEGLYRRAGNS